MNIRVVSSTEAQNQFGKLLDDAKSEPVMIQKNGRDQVVMISAETYQRIIQESGVNPHVSASLQRSMKRWDKLYQTLAK